LTVAIVDDDVISEIAAPKCVPRPPKGYSKQFIKRTLRRHFERISRPRRVARPSARSWISSTRRLAALWVLDQEDRDRQGDV